MSAQPVTIAVSDNQELAGPEAIAWAIRHQPTREAYQKCTGEDAGPVLDRYIAWAQENIIGDAF